jgi:hypothetical protein
MTNSVLQPGLTGLIKFIEFLKSERVTYSIHEYGNESLTVFFTVFGARFEVDFFEDRVNYSHFTGNEECLNDENEFIKLFHEGRNG